MRELSRDPGEIRRTVGTHDTTSIDDDIARVVALLGRDDVRNAVLHATTDPQLLELGGALPVPAGMTREQAVDIVTAVARASAAYSPIPDREGRLHWYIYGTRIRQGLSDIDRHCTTDSLLYEATQSRAGMRFLVQANVEESVAAAQLDDVNVDFITAKELLLMQRQPRTWEERLVLNQYRLAEHLPEMTGKPWAIETMLELYTLLTQGLPAEQIGYGANNWQERSAVLRGMCSYAEHPIHDRCAHAAIIASVLRAVVAYWQAFPAWNGMMSRIVFRFYVLKAGYPILGYIPISRSELALGKDRFERSAAHANVVPRGGGLLAGVHEADATPWLNTQVLLMAHALEQFRSRMRRAAVIDDAVREQLDAETELNHRQRSIVGRALRVPGATFRIGYHRTAHGIGYATAHRDFADLVRQGYLIETNQGRLKIFGAGPRIVERIGALSDIGRSEEFDVALPPELTR